MATRILLVLVVLTGVASAQQAPSKLTVGIYAPSVEFDTAQQRLAYVQGLAKAIEQNTGIPTTGLAYASLAQLKKDNPDYAIIEGQCYALNTGGWQLLANAQIGGSTTRAYALYASGGTTMQSLKGKKLAYVQTGCADAGFIDNAMLESEVDAGFFAARAGNNDLRGAIASVTSYKTAQAVFAPAGSAGNLTKVFDTGSVPNPAFVEVNNKLPASITSKVASAVTSYGGSGAINGWAKASRDPYFSLQQRLSPVRKVGVFAPAEPGRINSTEALQDPVSLKDPMFIAVRHLFEDKMTVLRATGGRMAD